MLHHRFGGASWPVHPVGSGSFWLCMGAQMAKQPIRVQLKYLSLSASDCSRHLCLRCESVIVADLPLVKRSVCHQNLSDYIII